MGTHKMKEEDRIYKNIHTWRRYSKTWA